MDSERSFSARAKEEMCRRMPQRKCCAAAELYGELLFANTFSPQEIKIVTEQEKFAARVAVLMKRVTGVQPECAAFGRAGKCAVSLVGGRAAQVYSFFGHEEGRAPAIHLNNAVVEEEHCREAFIRGLFLSSGSVSSPERNYHLELVTRHFNLSREVVALLLDMELQPKTAVRRSNYVIYFKDSASVEDFLTRAGAPAAAIRVMETKIEKDVRNQANRKVNCDSANITKTVDAAQKQLAAIRSLENRGAFNELSEPLRRAAMLRKENPDATLSELAALAGASRSGFNHRLTKIVALAEDRENE